MQDTSEEIFDELKKNNDYHFVSEEQTSQINNEIGEKMIEHFYDFRRKQFQSRYDASQTIIN